MATCSNPGCNKSGTKCCSSCNTTPYCGPICQTANWPIHREVCPGHLRKIGLIGLDNFQKAQGFSERRDWLQALRHADIAATKLKKAKNDIILIDDALRMKYNALGNMNRHKEALECAKEWYLMYPTNHTHAPAINASFAVIESCIHNKEYYDAALYSRTLWETITTCNDNHIPDKLREDYTARAASELAQAQLKLAESEIMPLSEQKVAGIEAIMLARRALQINIQLYGAESDDAACDMILLANILSYFNNEDDEEVFRLYEQAKAIYVRVYGSSSSKVASVVDSLARSFRKIAFRAKKARDMDRFGKNLELSLLHYREAARMYHADAHHVEYAESAAKEVGIVERAIAAFKCEREEGTSWGR